MTLTATRLGESVHRVFVVDDHPIVQHGLGLLLADEPGLEFCGAAADPADALEQIAALRPQVAVIDLLLNGESGLQLVREIRSRFPDVRILMVSMHDESLFAEEALRAGALGFLNKQEAPDQMAGALRQIARGEPWLSERVADSLLVRQARWGAAPGTSPAELLSPRELEVFRLVGEGQTTRAIAAELELSTKTIETYRENIKAKLNLSNGSELTRHAVRWVLEQSEDRSDENR